MVGVRVARLNQGRGRGDGALVGRFRPRPIAQVGLDVAGFDEGRDAFVLQIRIVAFLVDQLLIELVGRLQEIAPQRLQPLGLNRGSAATAV